MDKLVFNWQVSADVFVNVMNMKKVIPKTALRHPGGPVAVDGTVRGQQERLHVLHPEPRRRRGASSTSTTSPAPRTGNLKSDSLVSLVSVV